MNGFWKAKNGGPPWLVAVFPVKYDGRTASVKTGVHIADAGKVILSFAMLLGRLEIYTLLVLLMPEFWHA